MQYWLLKSDPEEYSWQDLKKDGTAAWTGIRNYQARNNLLLMKEGDAVLIYHSQTEKAVVGVAAVVSAPYPDPTEATWTVVDIQAGQELGSPVSLDVIKSNMILRAMPLVRHTRLSAMPITKGQFDEVLRVGK